MSSRPAASRWSWRGHPSLRRVLTLGIVAGLTVLGLEATGTLAAWTDSVPVDGTKISTSTLAPPTNVSVAQECRPDLTPVRRPGAGGFSTTTNAGSGTTITITKPSSAAANDVLLAALTLEGNMQSATINPPSGWTQVSREGDVAISQVIYTRVVQPSEPATYTWTSSLVSNKVGAIVAYSGVDTVNPVNAAAGQVDTDKGRSTAPSVNTTRGNAVLVAIFGLLNNIDQPVPTGMTGIWSAITTSQPHITQRGADESFPTAGPTGPRISIAPGTRTVGTMIALQPPAFPYATTTWTRSAAAWATGQEFRRSSGGTVQRLATLDAATTTQTGGPLVPGTSYTVDVTATFQNWRSTTSASSFTARGCWPP